MGPPCITFSKYGKGEKWSNKLLRAIHDCGTCFQRKCPISIHENVPQYEEAGLVAETGLDPTLFGHPNSRERTFRICYQKSKKKWACDMTLQQIADHMLVPKKTPLPLDFHVYILKQDHEHAHEEVDLTRSESNHLVKYRKVCPTNELFDLSANVEKRKRVELKNRTFPCLTTSSNFWSEKFLRKLSGRERLHVLNFPCWGPGASAACVDPVDTSMVPQRVLRHMSGNVMNLSCVGFVLLMSVLFVEDR
ncbi:unnamed protein product [Durusdinium trenchii]|uniref:Uncharacterized protein n=1 Tax=Durusdinium trenchii TaxID=1381693 RepID=A0ABP0IW06_9DINO